jgi:hypothetical protein
VSELSVEEESAGVENGKKEARKEKGGTETHGANSFDSSAARPLSLYIFSCLVVYALYGGERERLGYTDSSLVHPPYTHTQLFAIAMATLSCRVDRR